MSSLRRIIKVCWLLVLAEGGHASQRAWSVTDDVFAYPQYAVSIAPEHILATEAASFIGLHMSTDDGTNEDDEEKTYEQILLHQRPYLCTIPRSQSVVNETLETQSEEDQKKEMIEAASRGWELLKELGGKQCLYHTTGWWSYAFCYNQYVKQFHGVRPGTAGAPNWPPQEDGSIPSYFLGKHDAKAAKDHTTRSSNGGEPTDVQLKAESSYLVQKLRGGTPCDLTGKDRTIEIQYHCHPQSTDRIGWIKETATCAYLMKVYTPRLCNDVAFQQPRDSQAQMISCVEIVDNEQAASLEKASVKHEVQEPADTRTMVGNIEIGGMKYLGEGAKRIEKGRIVMTVEETAETVMMQKDGQIQGLSRTKLKELSLDYNTVEEFKKQVQEWAGKRDWKIERLEENGQTGLRATLLKDDEEDEKESGTKLEQKDSGKQRDQG